ncbi:MAG: ketol-acid reductoisomerase [Spirochaetota bacterium]|nr:ketol-acid reductoisomerase [Spirochaetota bacterium]
MGLDFESRIFKKEAVYLGKEKEYIVKGGRQLFSKLKQAFMGINQIGVIGWGSQGFAQSQNLRDSLKGTGINVKVGLRKGSASISSAEKAGFSANTNGIGELLQVVAESDLVIILISDAAQVELYPEIIKNIKPGATLGFSHGFLLGYINTEGISFPDNINIIGVCPKGMGLSVRRLYEQGKEIGGAGINTSFAIHRDVTGNAVDYALGWSIAIGAPFSFITTLENEYKSDIFGERGILLGAVYGVVESLFMRYISHGMNSKHAYLSTVESIVGPISRLISKKGLLAVYEFFHGNEKKIFEKAFCATYNPALGLLYEIYDEVDTGNEIRSILMAVKRTELYPMTKIENTKMWQVGNKVREHRMNDNIQLHPFTAGVYLAIITAQIDILKEKGHAYSEIANESVIEAVDSLNPYMHARGLSYMIDNCSITARFGARKWAPRFHYMLEEQVYPQIDYIYKINQELIQYFTDHPIHGVLDTCAKLRPSVDIYVEK